MICRKVKYASERDATLQIGKLLIRARRKKIAFRYYLCEICGVWHLTSKPDRKDGAIQDLKARIKFLEKENEALKNDTWRKVTTDLRTDERIKQLNANVQKLRKENNTLRQEISNLIGKLMAVQKTTTA